MYESQLYLKLGLLSVHMSAYAIRTLVLLLLLKLEKVAAFDIVTQRKLLWEWIWHNLHIHPSLYGWYSASVILFDGRGFWSHLTLVAMKQLWPLNVDLNA